jgi:mannose-6-phosphate isomerase-like protein (cupin superfamily)
MDEVREVVEGDGYAAGHIDEMGDRYGFRKVRRTLGVTAFGVNAIVFPPGVSAGTHWHDEQEEVYFVHSGRARFEFGDGSELVLGPGGTVRVDAPTHRRIANAGEEDLVVFIVGGKDGYVGRDGQAPEDEERVRPPA